MKIKSLLINSSLFIAVFLVTMTAYFYLYQMGLIQMGYEALLKLINQIQVVDTGKKICQDIGIVFFGLLPMVIYVIYAGIRMLLHQLGLWSYLSSEKALVICTDLGPVLGILGTLISLSQAMIFDLSGGTQNAIQAVSFRISQAMSSSIIGLSLSLFSFILLKLREKNK